MPRAIWTGSVGFGLVQIPVSLYSAENAHELDLTMLDKRDFSPVGYERINKRTKKPVPWSDVVKGYAHQKGQYVVLTERDFDEANVEATHQVDIEAFVDFAEIDPRYIERPYYLAPQKHGQKAYAVLRDTLQRTNKAGIGKVVLRSRQHLAALVAHERALLLVILRFEDELRDASGLDLPDKNSKGLHVSAKELAMAEKLVEGMTERFDPGRFRDDYHADLMALIKRKAKAGEINVVPGAEQQKPRKRPTGAKVIDLAALLAQSVEQGQGQRRKPKKSAAKHPKRASKRRHAA